MFSLSQMRCLDYRYSTDFGLDIYQGKLPIQVSYCPKKSEINLRKDFIVQTTT